MRSYSVEIARVHKASPYNCSDYIPEIKINVEFEEVINLPIVKERIDKTFGKHLIINIYSSSETSFLQYEVLKTTAII